MILLVIDSSLAVKATNPQVVILYCLSLAAGLICLYTSNSLRSIPNIVIFSLGDYLVSGLLTIVFTGLSKSVVSATVFLLGVFFAALAIKPFRMNPH